ncbi:S8 family serine peptidase [Streptomyces sp. VRA16 Mangrove soil]|uniref:S8 family serine peptidase n=1 Tax=Streptomyces sp. VRA16 Mangrove soil TaxID=2817434 RepID=UPI001A9FD483|nr:S8 family serine peptidase [Streptomyces sp. VRA16 Mangrove soil]MBO1330015.1 S8 family serine peptidase [Streptomyces sp. VRA16 Mangrove soil]
MRAISRTGLGAAVAAVLAVTAGGLPGAHAAPGASGDRPLVGSEAAQAKEKGADNAVVTLLTGDKVRVSTGADGHPTATLLPAEDGTEPVYTTRRVGDDLYVYPDGVRQKIDSGLVDDQLFNVTALVAQGYDDAHADALPVIVSYDDAAHVSRSLPAEPRGAERTHRLGVIDAVSYKADKKKSAEFWADLTSPRTRAGNPVEKLWLDARAQSTMADTTQQIGADLAWAAGYTGKGTKVAVLDTGIDAEHPDLKGQVAASKDFTDSDNGTEDVMGHGSHVASTVAGTGAASDGKEKGVAPDASLLVGKVLGNDGSGSASGIIAGMQWAVDSGADVISMSLGSSAPIPTCDDPMSTAAQSLARSSDSLFVIAAGNLGKSNNTVSSPGCAPDVLTVGAVDSKDDTAYFSSRGPVAGTHTLKPEIAAPGVAVKAVAAGGRGIYAYTTMSGTSMATPHVAGSAALLKQEHPDWSGQRIKQALVSSAKSDLTGDVRETGGGSLRVDQALKQTVLGAGSVQGGSFDWPQSAGDRTTVDVPYTNTGDKPVTLTLDVAHVTGNDGSAVRSRVAFLGKRTVTVPAGGTVKVPLALDPDAALKTAQYGDITGRVLATGPGGVHVSTPFSLYVQPRTVKLTLKLVDRGGAPAAGVSSFDVIGTDDATGSTGANDGATEQTLRLRAGNYEVQAFIGTPDAGDNPRLYDSLTYLGRPQLSLTKDTTLVLDARRAGRLKAVTKDHATETRGAVLGSSRTWDDYWMYANTISGGRSIRGYYADVRGEATDGDFAFTSMWRNAAPLISDFRTADGTRLHPWAGSTTHVNLDGTGMAEVVAAGAGTAQELAAAGVKGKIALVKLADTDTSMFKLADAAKAAGAVAVIGYHDDAARWTPATGLGTAPALPVLTLPSDEAKGLAAAPTKVTWKATAASPYLYNLVHTEHHELTAPRTYVSQDRDLARVDSAYTSAGVAGDFSDLVAVSTADGISGYPDSFDTVYAPGRRAEYFTADADVTFQRILGSSMPFGEAMLNTARSYPKGARLKENWYDGVLVPTAARDEAGAETLVGERQANLIGVNFSGAYWRDGSHYGAPGSFGDAGNLKLTYNGEDLGSTAWTSGVFEVPAARGTYELTLQTMKFGSPARFFQRSNQVQTVFRFTSAEDKDVYSQGLPLLFPKYGLPEDGMKTLAAKDGQTLTLSATGHQGYTPGQLVDAKVSYSYDGGETWTEAKTRRSDGDWSATVNHAGASGKQVTLRTQLTDDKGNSVTQTVTRAYDVR